MARLVRAMFNVLLLDAPIRHVFFGELASRLR
jgi:hypothetical protein